MTPLPGRLVLLGHPVAHSLSPKFQNAALRHEGIQLSYESLDVEPGELVSTVKHLAGVNAAGNVTIPHKRAMAELCSTVTPLATRVGAVNTFWHEGKRLCGDNTDVGGFDAAARELLGSSPSGILVGVLGAGGAAAAVLACVERWSGCRALVANRNPERAEEICARFSTVARHSDAATIARDAELVVNATSIGIDNDELPIQVEDLRAGAAVLDLVYKHGQTAWARAARQRGLRASDGLPMLIEQGALAFERWFQCPAPRAVMRAALS